jgi:hypothetical protein
LELGEELRKFFDECVLILGRKILMVWEVFIKLDFLGSLLGD